MANQLPLSSMRILIVNDDGINSAGIKILERVCNSLSPDVWVIAPATPQSGKGQATTFDDPLRIQNISSRKFAINGTPSDCVFIALGHILVDKKPDLIVSGINHGGNYSDFLCMSGTVCAALAAATLDVKAIAISQEMTVGCEPKFVLADHFLPGILKKLVSIDWDARTVMNVNFPNAQVGSVSGIKVAKQGGFDFHLNIVQRSDPVGKNYCWINIKYDDDGKEELSDYKLLSEQNAITVTPIKAQLTNTNMLERVEELFSTNV